MLLSVSVGANEAQFPFFNTSRLLMWNKNPLAVAGCIHQALPRRQTSGSLLFSKCHFSPEQRSLLFHPATCVVCGVQLMKRADFLAPR